MDLDLIMESLKTENDTSNYLLVDDGDYANNGAEFSASSSANNNNNSSSNANNGRRK